MAAAAASPETALSAAGGPEDEQDECRICRFPAEAGRPLRRPCACRGSIRFVHDDCELRWLAARNQRRCEVCNHDISTRPLYATDAPARLPVSEFMVRVPSKLMGLLIPLFFAVCVVREFIIPLTTLWTWRLALARTFAQVYHLFSLRLSVSSILASVALWATFAREVAPSAVAPFVRWNERLGTKSQSREFGLFDALQILAVLAVDVSLVVVIADMALAYIFCFLPFSLGRIILWWRSCLHFGNVDEVNSYTSTASFLLIGYGFIFKVAATFAGVHTFYQYLRGKRLVAVIFFRSLLGIFFRGIINSTTVANISLNILNVVIIYPLFFGWLLDICTSKMFDATMSQRFKLLIASSFASAALHWLIGWFCLYLRPILSKLLDKILGPGVTTLFVHRNVSEPFYKFYFKTLVDLFVDTIFIALVIGVPIKIADLLAPKVFPLDITYFDRPAKGTSVWEGPLSFLDSLSAALHMVSLIGKIVRHLGRLVERVMAYWFVTTGQDLGNNVVPKDQYGSSDDAKNEWRFSAIRTMLRVVVPWLTAVIFNSAMLLFPVSVGRAFLFAIPQLPVAGGLKSNDLFVISVGFCITSTILAASRDLSAWVISGGPCLLLALKRQLLYFIWMVIVPLQIGLLVDLTLISPFVGPDDDFPVLNFFCTLVLGRFVKRVWTNNLINERGQAKLYRANGDFSAEPPRPMWWFFQDVCMPTTRKLLTLLGVPYVLAKGIFPILGCSAAANSTVYRFAWLGSLGFCALCCLANVFYVMLHDSIRDDRYVIGRRLEDVGNGAEEPLS